MAKKKNSNSLKALEQQAIKSTESQLKNNRSKSRAKNIKTPKSLMISVIILFIFVIGWISGIFSWSIKYIECGNAPVIVTSGIGGGRSVRVYPGDKDYGPGLFENYTCMDPAEKAGKRY